VQDSNAPFDAAATAWLLAGAVLALLMTPGIAFFYGGMVRRTNVLAVVMQGFAGMAVVSLLWVAVGFSIAFGGNNRFIGDLTYAGLPPGAANPIVPAVPLVAFALFQMMFAVLTPTLILGAGAERWRFGAYVVFAGIWSVVVYAPVAHWVFDPRGWAAQWGMLDFAGGTVVHINAGVAALAIAGTLGRRRGWPDQASQPHNLPLVMTGLALLWFGWLGLNGGSAYGAGPLAASAMLNTQMAAGAALLAWIVAERIRYGKPTTLGAASGAVAGLVAITPAAGYVTALGAMAIGVIAGVLCHLAVGLKRWFGVDDSLDVAAVHLGGGLIGCVCVGLFAAKAVNPEGADGLFYSGSYRFLGVQAGTAAIVAVYALVATLVLVTIINRVMGHRVRRRQEALGLDLALHGEAAYDLGSVASEGTEPPEAEPVIADASPTSFADMRAR
jgi:Amt family ammonium transporter